MNENNKLAVFSNPDFGEVRTLEINGEPWFVGKDIAEALEYTNPRKAIREHVDDDDKQLFKGNETFPLVIPNRTMQSVYIAGIL